MSSSAYSPSAPCVSLVQYSSRRRPAMHAVSFRFHRVCLLYDMYDSGLLHRVILHRTSYFPYAIQCVRHSTSVPLSGAMYWLHRSCLHRSCLLRFFISASFGCLYLHPVDRMERWFKCWRACARHPQPMQGAPWRSSAWKRNTAVKACMAHNTPAWFIGLVCDVSVVSCYSAVTVSKWSTACFTAFDSGFSDRAPCSTHCNKSTALTASAFLYLGIKSFNAQPV